MIQSFIRQNAGKSGSPSLITHLRRELFQSCYDIILRDPEFHAAWKYGTLIKCGDGVIRRVFIRLGTYSADYPEK